MTDQRDYIQCRSCDRMLILPLGSPRLAPLIAGESAVGKSSVVLRFCQNDFQPNKEPTIGAAFLTQRCRLGKVHSSRFVSLAQHLTLLVLACRGQGDQIRDLGYRWTRTIQVVVSNVLSKRPSSCRRLRCHEIGQSTHFTSTQLQRLMC